jgi:hypothetical protein
MIRYAAIRQKISGTEIEVASAPQIIPQVSKTEALIAIAIARSVRVNRISHSPAH